MAQPLEMHSTAMLEVPGLLAFLCHRLEGVSTVKIKLSYI